MTGVLETGPDRLSSTQSLGDIIAAAGAGAVHILFVHGIRTGDRGSSAAFRAGVGAHAPGVSRAPTMIGNHRLPLGPSPGITYMGAAIFETQADWEAGAPFVDRFIFERPDSGPIVVDEVNWWPLALPLRLHALLEPEAALAGADAGHLKLAAGLDDHERPLEDGVHHAWLSKQRLDALLAHKPPLGGAATANGYVKRELMDWGLSDAVIALGPMKHYLHDAIDLAFGYAAAAAQARPTPTQFVVVAESLGSFIVFDAYAHAKSRVQELLDDTAFIYFFANQLALLELGRLHDPSPRAVSMLATTGQPLSLHQALTAWAAPKVRAPRQARPGAPDLKQIIAFSDPSDALTFRVPPIPNALVVNVCDRNGWDLFHRAADPIAAHTGHSRNPHVLDILFKRQARRPGSPPA